MVKILSNQNSNLLQRNSTTNSTRRVDISTSIGKKIVLSLKIPTVPLAGRLVHFLGCWEKLTKDQNILQIIKRYRIFPLQTKTKREPKEINFSMQENETISLEVENLLKKGAVEQVCPQKDQFLSNIFIVKKKDGGNRPVINLKELNQYISFLHFNWRVYSCWRLFCKKTSTCAN